MEENKITQAISDCKNIESGVLSTHSLDLEGYPFGSVTPFALDLSQRPIILISEIAQHTKNLISNPKCSLTIFKNDTNAQDNFRVTVLGDASVSEDPLIAQKYLQFFPEAKSYFQTHNFSFYVLEPVRIRYIGGFGKIFWIEKEVWKGRSVEWQEEEQSIISHMNEDHNDVVQLMGKSLGDSSSEVKIIALDSFGCHLKGENGIYYFPLDQVCLTKNQLREAFVAIAKRLKST